MQIAKKCNQRMQKHYIAAGVLAAMEQPPEQHARSF
jgi:hypothetical protein